MGCPIRATMETVYLGDTPEGMRVYGDRYACAADAVILCNRVKPHTAFEGPYESGLMKMSVIGLGKQHGAEQVHRDGFSDLGRLLPMIGRVVFDHAPIALGVGLVENAFDDTCLVRALTAEEIWGRSRGFWTTPAAGWGRSTPTTWTCWWWTASART
jgi:hypothetical protein